MEKIFIVLYKIHCASAPSYDIEKYYFRELRSLVLLLALLGLLSPDLKYTIPFAPGDIDDTDEYFAKLSKICCENRTDLKFEENHSHYESQV